MDKFVQGDVITLNDDKDYIIVNVIDYKGSKYLNLLLSETESKMLLVKIIYYSDVMLLSEDLTDEEIDGVLKVIAEQ